MKLKVGVWVLGAVVISGGLYALATRTPKPVFWTEDSSLIAIARPKVLKAPDPVIDKRFLGIHFYLPIKTPEGFQQALQVFRRHDFIAGCLIAQPPVQFSDSQWTIDGRAIDQLAPRANDHILGAPYVFGKEPKIAMLQPSRSAKAIKVRLPANGIEVQMPTPQTLAVGPFRVQLDFSPVATPIEALQMRCRVLDAEPGQKFAITLETSPHRVRGRVGGGESIVASFSEWKEDERFDLTIEPLKVTERHLTIRRKIHRATFENQLLDESGRAINPLSSRIENGKIVFPWLPSQDATLALDLPDEPYVGRHLARTMYVGRPGNWVLATMVMRRFSDGQKIKASLAVPTNRYTVPVRFKLPNRTLFEPNYYQYRQGGFESSPPQTLIK